MLTAQQLIEEYQLAPHPEGGYYRQTYRSTEILAAQSLPERFGADRHISTAIYFLLEATQYSAFHRIKSDELWHFYTGTPLHIYVIHPNGHGEILKLGPDITNGYAFQHMVPAGSWFAAKPATSEGFSFVGCTVAPGFDFEDFELGIRDELLRAFPGFGEWIEKMFNL